MSTSTETINRVYHLLLGTYGPQGWWPVFTLRKTENRDERGYSIGTGRTEDFSPLSRFVIAAGAVLTQNTSWKNVEKALDTLSQRGLLNPVNVLEADHRELAAAIRPSGYYNQKSKKLKILASFLLKGGYLDGGKIPGRKALTGLWGIGKETADSILLYAYAVPVFVVDAYTKRIFSRLGVLTGDEGYDEIAEKFSVSLGRGAALYQEYHALIVTHAKEHCRKKPLCTNCVLKRFCRFNG